MAFHKLLADELFDGYTLSKQERVLILAEDGTVQGLVPSEDAGEGIRRLSGILVPGLVNCHCHLELSHLRNRIPEKTGLLRFVSTVMAERAADEEEVFSAIASAEEEMRQGGIVAVGDICNTSLTGRQKAAGNLHYHSFVEATGFDPRMAGHRFEHCRLIATQLADHPGVRPETISIVPHAPYSVSDELWNSIVGLPGNRLLSMHNQETPAENELFRDGTGEWLKLYEQLSIDTSRFRPTGQSSLQSVLPRFKPSQSVILVHNVETSADDLQLAAASGLDLSWCLCPNANLYISGVLPPVELLVRGNCRIVIGTDSLASNQGLGILAELKMLRHHFPRLPLSWMLKWATLNGAEALHLESLLGSFDPGKRPGVTLISSDLETSTRIV